VGEIAVLIGYHLLKRLGDGSIIRRPTDTDVRKIYGKETMP
jgi:hypothetical protein